MTMMSRRQAVARVARALVVAAGATVATGETADTYDTSRHTVYAARRLRALIPRNETNGDDDANANGAWLRRERPQFPYVVALSPGDNPARIDRLLGSSIVGSASESTAATLAALVEPEHGSLDALVQTIAIQWRAFKTFLRGDVPAAFDDAQQRALERRLAVLLAALKDASVNETVDPIQETQEADPVGDKPTATDGDATQPPTPPSPTVAQQGERLVFYLRDFDEWDDAAKTAWFQWVHEVTSEALAHVVLPTRAPVTPTTMQMWQRVFKVPNADLVAILLRAATRACDPSEATDKLTELNNRFALGLRGLTKEEIEGQEDDDTIGFAPPKPPTEAQLIVDTVGNWWRDLEIVCQTLKMQGLGRMENDDDRLMLVQRVCDEYERKAMHHVTVTLGVHDPGRPDEPVHIGDAHRDDRISALQAWKCLEVVTQVGDDAQILASPQKLMQRDTSKPTNCAHPVEALLPFNQRVHGEAKFMNLIDEGILFLRPKSDVEIGVLPCDAKVLVAPCWVETRPLIKRAFEKLWRDDTLFQKILELERFEDNYKLSEEVALYEEEINERCKEFDAQTREFIMLQHTMKKHEVAQRKAELALLELEIQSKLVYLERLRGLLE